MTLQVDAIDCYYGNVQVLRGLSLDLADGEVLCLLGRNGAGKTTALKAIMGLIHPHAGRVVLDGIELSALPAHEVARHGIAYVPQGRRLFAELTVAENLAIGLMTRGHGPDACIDAVGMEAHEGGFIGMYDKVKQVMRMETDRPFVLRQAIMACRKGGTVSVIGASQGGFGTILAQNGWLPVLRTLRTRHWMGGRLMVSRAQQVFDESGALQDEAIRSQLDRFLAGFARFVESSAPESA